MSYIDLVSAVLTPLGFAVVSSVVELVPEDDAKMIAEDGTGAEFNYGQGTFQGSGGEHEIDQEAFHWFGEAILRPDPEPFLSTVTITNSKGEIIHVGEHVKGQQTDLAAAAKPGPDSTKFDVTINGAKQESLPKRRAVLTIVRHLCDQGITPEEITAVIPWRSTIFRSVDGTVSSEAFIAQQKANVDAGDIRRYFCDDSELIHCSGRTYAVTKGWGGRAFEAIQNVLAKFPDKGVKCEKHSKV